MKWFILFLATVVTIVSGTPSIALAARHRQTVVCENDYTVQLGDSISVIAQKYFGDLASFGVIVNATNLAAQEDSRYTSISNADVIEVGQLLCIVSPEDAPSFQSQQPAAPEVQAEQPAPVANVPAAAVNPENQTISFSHDSVVTSQPFQLTLNNLVDGEIRYTTNGSYPNENSTPYAGPISIDRSTVIRAQVFNSDGSPAGEVQTRSYLVEGYAQTIPVVSIVADWGDLNAIHEAARERGIEWERPINMEYFAPGGQLQFNVKAGIRIHGNFSRLFNPKKSYRLYFRKSYGGPGNLDYPLFPDSPVTKFDKLVLRAGFQDTFTHRGIPDRADRHLTAKYIGDQVARNLHRDMGQPVAHGSWVLLYLNGEFWGLYNLAERVDQQMLRSYTDKDSNWDIIVKESGWDDLGQWYSQEEVREGGYGAWLENQNWVGSADFSNPGNIGVLEWRVDLENLFSYLFLQAYIQNTDWPSANWLVYRRNDPGASGNEAQWRMLVWDAEDSFGTGGAFKLDENTIVRTYSPHDSITRILEKPYIHNCALKHRFVQRAREYLGVENEHGRPENEIGQLSKERVKAEVLRQAEIVRPFIQMETDRWAPDLPGVDLFEQNIANTLRFVEEREEVILNHLDILRYQTFTECK